MSHLDRLVEQAKDSELFTSPRLADDMGRFLATHRDRIREMARDARDRGVTTVYFMGAGGSWSAMYLGKYLADRFTTLTTDAILSYDLIWRNPRRLGPDSLVFCASYSGGTEDTLAALRHAKAAGARTVAVVSKAASKIGTEADEVIAYEATALYNLPMAAVSLFALEWARLEGNGAADEVLAGFDALPEIIAGAYASSQERGRELAEAFLPAQLLYCLGSGPLYGLAYKFALTVFMENIRTHGAFIESAEFRHGPAEALERQRPEMVYLLGQDESRPMVERSLEIARSRGAKVATIDAAGYAGLHPLLSAFVLKVPLQWFVVYSALLRGIDDLDERVLMGRNVLAEGGATWP